MKLLRRIYVSVCTLCFTAAFGMAGTFSATGATSGLTYTGSGTPSYGSGSASLTVGAGTGGVSIGGTLSTTYSWTPANGADPTPTKVVVIESCNVTSGATAYYGGSYTTPSSSAGNGMGTDWSTTSNNNLTTIYVVVPPAVIPIGTQTASSSTGTRARILDVTSGSVTVTASPSAAAVSTSGSQNAAISYSVVGVYPAYITVEGTTEDDDYLKILSGQPATGEFHIGGSGVTVKDGTYSWSVSGITFKDFVVVPDESGHAIDMEIEDWEVAEPTWRWTLPYNSVVTGSVELEYQAGSYAKKSIGTITHTKNVEVVAVPNELDLEVYTPGQLIVGATVNLTSDPAGSNPAMEIEYEATTPALFASVSNGKVFPVQLLYDTDFKVNGSTVKATVDHDLDNLYPYALAEEVANGTPAFTNDSPGITVALAATSCSIDLTADMFTLYEAPGGAPVPLKKATWEHHSSAQKSGTWSLLTNTTTRTSNGTDEPDHPDWSNVFVNL